MKSHQIDSTQVIEKIGPDEFLQRSKLGLNSVTNEKMTRIHLSYDIIKVRFIEDRVLQIYNAMTVFYFQHTVFYLLLQVLSTSKLFNLMDSKRSSSSLCYPQTSLSFLYLHPHSLQS